MDLDVTSTLQEFLQAHSISTQFKDQWLIWGLASSSAWIFRRPSADVNNLVRLNINVRSPLLGGRTLVECFAGWGSDEQEAISSAWGKFSRSCLHVLMQVFMNDPPDKGQVEWETWGSDDNLWRVCMGPLLILNFRDRAPLALACGDLLDQLRDKLLPILTGECHWLRFYYMKQGDKRVGSECLLDNDTWPEGEKLVDQWSWPKGFYSARLFLIMLPEPINRRRIEAIS